VDRRRLRMEASNTLQSLLPAEAAERRIVDLAWAHCFMDAIEAVLSLKHLRRVSFHPEVWRSTTRMLQLPLRLLQLARPTLLASTSTIRL